MARPPQDVTDTELALLNLLWEQGAATVRELAERLYQKSSSSQNATVQKLLERLEDKGCVRRNADVWPYTFQAAIERDELIGRRLQQTADKLCEGSFAPLLTHLVKAGRLSAEDRQSLRSLLEELNEENNRKKKQ
jgi:predicted transcriptional regulator